MRETFLPFARPSITDAEIEAVVETLRSGWITAGPQVEEFERQFALYVGAQHAVSVSSATAGLHLTLQALGIGSGHEVITTSLTWPSTVNMIHNSGAQPVFTDIDRATLQLDPERVAEMVTPRTRAIVPVHFGGQPADIGMLREICRQHNLVLIEDAAHAVGTEYQEHRIGDGTNPAIFSFHAIKNLTTGEGGMVTTNDDALARKLRSLRFHGVDKDAWKRHAQTERNVYDLVEPGWKYNLTDLQAAIGLAQLKRLDDLLRQRSELAHAYDTLFAELPQIRRPERVRYPHLHSWHLYTILVDREHTGLDRDEFRQELMQRSIGTGLHFLAVHQLSFYQEPGRFKSGQLEQTEHIAARILSLPLFPGMTTKDVEDVVAAIRDVMGSR